jgi:hypothetical protein
MNSKDFVNVKPKKAVEPAPVIEESVVLEYPEFNLQAVQEKFENLINETASAGVSSAGAVATVVKPLGEKGGTASLIKRQKSYSNQRTAGGTVKVKK